jgi:hypothetical protein
MTTAEMDWKMHGVSAEAAVAATQAIASIAGHGRARDGERVTAATPPAADGWVQTEFGPHVGDAVVIRGCPLGRHVGVTGTVTARDGLWVRVAVGDGGFCEPDSVEPTGTPSSRVVDSYETTTR